VVANAQLFIGNNQEMETKLANSHIDERTRFEMYYPPFEGAFEANVGSIMCGQNKVNGNSTCGNDQILN
jgi:beta-glucosidase